MAVTFLKTTFPKAKPKIIEYRDQKDFVLENFKAELDGKLTNEDIDTYAQFHEIFLNVLGKHACPNEKENL